MGEIEGVYEIPEFSNDNEDEDIEVRVGYRKDESKLKDKVDRFVRNDAVRQLRSALKEFVNELKSK